MVRRRSETFRVIEKTSHEIEKLPPILTLKRVAEIVGVSRRTIRAWAHAGRLPVRRVNNAGSVRLYFDARDVLAMITPQSPTPAG